MRLNLKNIALFALSLGFMASCSSEDIENELLKTLNDTPEEVEPGFVEAPKCNGTVTVKVINPTDSRASNVDGSIDRYTATRCDGAGGDYTLVSFHGRNQEQIGMVQIIRSSTGQVISELNTLDARVNFAQFRRDSRDVRQFISELTVTVRTGFSAVSWLCPLRITALSEMRHSMLLTRLVACQSTA